MRTLEMVLKIGLCNGGSLPGEMVVRNMKLRQVHILTFDKFLLKISILLRS